VGARLHPHHGYEHNYTTKYNNYHQNLWLVWTMISLGL
jgi:hypothetical protein